ncbi:methyltransferase domain-containing protein [Sediminibacterium sp.]|uniref:methyltransferase domain-containing protein n=1 Tax=Sediminibacterium sp. TaxID=1917865 RepID=UPI0025E363AC|nr:methyltransferase domain-containing protein [Sediminibacterium sp.]MBW0178185.1 class I SAM-dependent methyltransferase [Sediminibacterium sp.]
MLRIILCLLVVVCSSNRIIQKTDELPGITEIREYKLETVDTLVDIGCQDGLFSREIARFYPNVFLVLEDLEFFTLCNKSGKKCTDYFTQTEIKKTFRDSRKYQNIENRYRFIAGRIDSIPLATSSYKRVLCRRTVHEFEKTKKMVSELKRILKTDGILTIVEPEPNYKNHIDEFCNKKYLTKNEVLEIFKDFKLLTFRSIPYGSDRMNMFNFSK